MKIKVLLPFLFLSSFANAQYTKILDFDSIKGSNPLLSDIISDGAFLYGMTSKGGSNNKGVIFKIKPDGTAYSKLLDFTGVANGSEPYGSLISYGTFLYGMTTIGGTSGYGTIFKIKPDGTAYSKLFDFDGINGGAPWGSLISDSVFLYGMSQYGGTNDSGIIFKIKHDGTGYSTVLDFTGANGRMPYGSLISDGTFLYGMTYYGGSNYFGILFKIKPDGTGYSKLLDFDVVSNGAGPSGSLIYDGVFLYGMAGGGGSNNLGTIFKIKPDGTGYAKLLDFAGANGGEPMGSLVSHGTFLYGITHQGGANGMGVIFKIKPDGTGYSKLLDFTGTANGGTPWGSITSDGAFLYGMTEIGGINNLGVIFKYQDTTVVGIDEHNMQNDFTISPNPTTGIFTIQIGNGQLSIDNYQLSIYNVLGEKIIPSPIGGGLGRGQVINLSAQPSGIYFLRIKTPEGTAVKKIVKQ